MKLSANTYNVIKNNMNYTYIVMGHKLAIMTQETGLGAIFGGQKKSELHIKHC